MNAPELPTELFRVEVLAHLNTDVVIVATDEEDALVVAEERMREALSGLDGSLPLVEALNVTPIDRAEVPISPHLTTRTAVLALLVKLATMPTTDDDGPPTLDTGDFAEASELIADGMLDTTPEGEIAAATFLATVEAAYWAAP